MLLILIIRQNIIKFRNYCSLLPLLLTWPALHVYIISFYFSCLISTGVKVLNFALLLVYFLNLFFFFLLLSSSLSSLLSSLLPSLHLSKPLNYKLTQPLNT